MADAPAEAIRSAHAGEIRTGGEGPLAAQPHASPWPGPSVGACGLSGGDRIAVDIFARDLQASVIRRVLVDVNVHFVKMVVDGAHAVWNAHATFIGIVAVDVDVDARILLGDTQGLPRTTGRRAGREAEASEKKRAEDGHSGRGFMMMSRAKNGPA